ncbi:MAG: aspartate aminotransferase family protein [Gemmatimonadetes bacterium]|nr:aspartate aminotransferase family protein [Gemmatimonadota bacterium]
MLGPVPGPASRALARRLRDVESRNVTWLADDFPVFWEAAAGSNVRDADGNEYLDLTGAFGVAFAGHANPRVVAAVREQAGRLVHGMGDIHPPGIKVRLLEALAAFSPWDDARAVLGTSGSEAVEIALKTALLATGRPGVVAFRGAYHGLMGGALPTTERPAFREPFRARLFDGVGHAPFPTRAEDQAAALEALERMLEDGVEGHAVGCVIVEPIQGRAGVRVPPAGFLTALAERARDAGALVAFDEVFTGCGRTGRRFALEHEGVVPDLLCLGKALGGGLPLSACLGPREVMDAWPPSTGEALHTSTFLGHPLASAAALAFLEDVEERGLVARADGLGARLRADLALALADVPGVREVRGRGLFLGIELESEGAGVALVTAALAEGLLLLPAGDLGEVVELTPAATLGDEQATWAVDALAGLARTWARA